jgi:hypothetical protein
MRQECELCGEYVECKDGVCGECRLEGYEDETSEETEKKEVEDNTSYSRCSTR